MPTSMPERHLLSHRIWQMSNVTMFNCNHTS
jgi:hypothetical protein